MAELEDSRPDPTTGSGRTCAALRRDNIEAGLGRPHQATIGHWLVNLTGHQVTRVTDPSPAALRFHMARLRHKLEDNPARPRHLLTEPGMGYRYLP